MLAIFLSTLVALVSSPSAVSPSHITGVTVYPDRAEITREIRLDTRAGAKEFLIGPLPIQMDDSSLRVSGRTDRGEDELVLSGIEVRTVPGVEVRGPELEAAEAEMGRRAASNLPQQDCAGP